MEGISQHAGKFQLLEQVGLWMLPLRVDIRLQPLPYFTGAHMVTPGAPRPSALGWGCVLGPCGSAAPSSWAVHTWDPWLCSVQIAIVDSPTSDLVSQSDKISIYTIIIAFVPLEQEATLLGTKD